MTKKILFYRMNDDRGDVIVEATILFPIIILIFAGFVLLATYIPVRGNVQRAAQYAASIIGIQESDTWITYDKEQLKQRWMEKSELPNVYVQLFGSLIETSRDRSKKQETAEAVVTEILRNGILGNGGEVEEIKCEVKNYVIYKEVIVTVEYEVQLPFGIPLIGLSSHYLVTESATAIVDDGDGFVRNVDMLTDFVSYLDKKYNLKLNELSGCLNQVFDFMGI